MGGNKEWEIHIRSGETVIAQHEFDDVELMAAFKHVFPKGEKPNVREIMRDICADYISDINPLVQIEKLYQLGLTLRKVHKSPVWRASRMFFQRRQDGVIIEKVDENWGVWP